MSPNVGCRKLEWKTDLKIEIAHFEENDREQLKLIYLEVRQTNFTWLSQESFRLSSFDKDTEGEIILVAKVDNKIVGFASLWRQDNFLHHLYVSNSFSGQRSWDAFTEQRG